MADAVVEEALGAEEVVEEDGVDINLGPQEEVVLPNHCSTNHGPSLQLHSFRIPSLYTLSRIMFCVIQLFHLSTWSCVNYSC